MYFVFGNLPDNVNEEEIKDFLSQFSMVEKVSFFDQHEKSLHSDYECIVSLKINNRISGMCLQKRLNHYYWKDRCIHTHMLLF